MRTEWNGAAPIRVRLLAFPNVSALRDELKLRRRNRLRKFLMRFSEKLQQDVLAIVEVRISLAQRIELLEGFAVQADMNDVIHGNDPYAADDGADITTATKCRAVPCETFISQRKKQHNRRTPLS